MARRRPGRGRDQHPCTSARSTRQQPACPRDWRLAIRDWQDLPAFMDWSAKAKVGTLHDGTVVVQALW